MNQDRELRMGDIRQTDKQSLIENVILRYRSDEVNGQAIWTLRKVDFRQKDNKFKDPKT